VRVTKRINHFTMVEGKAFDGDQLCVKAALVLARPPQ
jgi:hypothetical protein